MTKQTCPTCGAAFNAYPELAGGLSLVGTVFCSALCAHHGKCQCEDVSHLTLTTEGTRATGCPGYQAAELSTDFGRFKVCLACVRKRHMMPGLELDPSERRERAVEANRRLEEKR